MKNLKRAARLREMKRFKPGDWVTWGIEVCVHQVVEVNERGVVVDVTGEKDAHWFARLTSDNRHVLTVLFDHNMQGPGPRCRFREPGVTSGPPIKVDIEEWRAKQAEHKLRFHSFPW